MVPSDNPPPGDEEQRRGGPPPGDEDQEALRRLQEQIGRASQAAERLVGEATRAAARGTSAKPPPSGWQRPDSERPSVPRPAADFEALLRALQSLRDLIPTELQQRLAEALRELLLALRALVDWALERLERRARQPDEVKDIPIL